MLNVNHLLNLCEILCKIFINLLSFQLVRIVSVAEYLLYFVIIKYLNTKKEKTIIEHISIF